MTDFHSAFDLDAETGELIWRNPPKNHAELAGKPAGYICRAKGKNKDYWHIRLGGKTYKRGRVVYFMTHGCWPEPCLDHINGNSLDDRPANLRAATLLENRINSAPKPRRHDLPQGVSQTKQGKFMARIAINGRVSSLGVYATPEDASHVYESKRKEVYGTFA